MPYTGKMDIQSLTPPPAPLSIEEARTWLRSFQSAFPIQRQRAQDWAAALEPFTPPSAVASAALSEDFVRWLDENQLREGPPTSMWLSLRGVGVVVSNDHPRLAPPQAWQQAARLLAAADWVNAAPAEQAPMRVADILLFGSMTDPLAQDHGDLDALVLLEPKQEGGGQACEAFLSAHALDEILHPDGLSFPSFRRGLMDWMASVAPFSSLDDSPRSLAVLLDADPQFSCYSLMKRVWDVPSLAGTTADEDSEMVMRALENGQARPAARAHISRSLTAARSELGFDDSSVVASSAWALGLECSSVKPHQSIWWAGLNSPPSSGAASRHPGAVVQWNTLREQALKCWGLSSHPQAQLQRERWGRTFVPASTVQPPKS